MLDDAAMDEYLVPPLARRERWDEVGQTGDMVWLPAPAPMSRGQEQPVAVAGGGGWCLARCQQDAPEAVACLGRLMRPNPD